MTDDKGLNYNLEVFLEMKITLTIKLLHLHQSPKMGYIAFGNKKSLILYSSTILILKDLYIRWQYKDSYIGSR